MKKNIVFLFALISLFSCRREQAFFQKSQPIVYQASPKKTNAQVSIQDSKHHEETFVSIKEELPESTPVFIQSADNQSNVIEEVPSFSQDIIKRKGRFLRKALKAERNLSDKIESIGSKKVFESEKRKGNFLDDINTKIKIGVVFLAIAIILGLLGLKTIAIIFAIAAVLYLAWGLKRVFR